MIDGLAEGTFKTNSMQWKRRALNNYLSSKLASTKN